MTQAASYVRTLFCAALICGVLVQLSGPKGTGSAPVRMICGMFLAILAISPLKQTDFGALGRDLDFFSRSAETAVFEGRKAAESALTEDISRRCRAYILDKAGEMGFSVEASVEVDPRTHLPIGVLLSGEVPAAGRETLTACLSGELGIERGKLRWKPPE